MPVKYLLPAETVVVASKWGKIEGNIKDQEDLSSELDNKADISHNHNSDYEPKDENIQLHLASGDNPHNVTKFQIGLGNVLNEEQLKKSDFTAKGDLLVGLGESQYDKLSAGSNGYVLTADNSNDKGIDWKPVFELNSQVLSGNITLSNNDFPYQSLNPNGTNRIITLPASGSFIGQFFIIRNSQSHSSSGYLTIKEGNTDIEVVYSQGIKAFIWDGTYWQPFYPGTGASQSQENLVIGNKAAGVSYATSFGSLSNGTNAGVAVGRAANGGYDGVAVGYSSTGSGQSVAIGRQSNTNSKANSVALGYYSKVERHGEVVKTADSSGSPKYLKSEVQWFGETNAAAQTEIFLNGSNQRCVLISQSSITFLILVTARNNNLNKTKSWKIEGSIQRNSSNSTSLIGSITKSVIADSGVNWDITAEADDTNEALVVKVSGEQDATIRWHAVGFFSEVRF